MGVNAFREKNLEENPFVNYVNEHPSDEKLKTQKGFINMYNLLYDKAGRADWTNYVKGPKTILSNEHFFDYTDSDEQRKRILAADFMLSRGAAVEADESLQEAIAFTELSQDGLEAAFNAGQIDEFMRQFNEKILSKSGSGTGETTDSAKEDAVRKGWNNLTVNDRAGILSDMGIPGEVLKVAVNKEV